MDPATVADEIKAYLRNLATTSAARRRPATCWPCTAARDASTSTSSRTDRRRPWSAWPRTTRTRPSSSVTHTSPMPAWWATPRSSTSAAPGGRRTTTGAPATRSSTHRALHRRAARGVRARALRLRAAHAALAATPLITSFTGPPPHRDPQRHDRAADRGPPASTPLRVPTSPRRAPSAVPACSCSPAEPIVPRGCEPCDPEPVCRGPLDALAPLATRSCPASVCGPSSTTSGCRSRLGDPRRAAAHRTRRLGSALEFFLYDTPKVLLLLALVVFGVGIVRSFFTPERTRRPAARPARGHGQRPGRAVSASSPRSAPARPCRCSSALSRPACRLGVTFSFLIAAPMVNEIALVLLYGLFGWKVAALYLGTGLAHRHGRRLGHRPAQDGALRRGLGAARSGWARRRGASTSTGTVA